MTVIYESKDASEGSLLKIYLQSTCLIYIDDDGSVGLRELSGQEWQYIASVTRKSERVVYKWNDSPCYWQVISTFTEK